VRETVKSGYTDEARLDVLERMLDAFDEHDLDAIMALFADDCVFDSPRGPDPWRRFEGEAVWTFRGAAVTVKNSYWKIIE
jgi:ketosteroid isomerase-like protein